MKNKQKLWIEPNSQDHSGTLYAVFTLKQAPRHSVLAGQWLRTYVDGGTLEELEKKYPNIDMSEFKRDYPVCVPSEPPEWFDPANAGESWDEE